MNKSRKSNGEKLATLRLNANQIKMDYYKLREKRTMTPEKMIKILEQHGTIISKEKAGIVLELVYKLSNLSVGETIRNAQIKQKKLRMKTHIPKYITEDS